MNKRELISAEERTTNIQVLNERIYSYFHSLKDFEKVLEIQDLEYKNLLLKDYKELVEYLMKEIKKEWSL